MNNQDFTGQDLAYKIQERLVTITGIVSFIVGFYCQKFHYTVWTTLAGLAVTVLICVPSWPMFCRNKVNWLPPENRDKRKNTNEQNHESDKQK